MSLNDDDDGGGGYKRRPRDGRDDRSRGGGDNQAQQPDALSPLNWIDPPRQQSAKARNQRDPMSPLNWLDRLGDPDEEAATGKGPDSDRAVSPDPVQAKGDLAGPDVQATAAQGVATAASPLPHLDRIQQSFGRHDLSHVRTQLGGAGTDAAESIGAEAYATGHRIAFADPSPSLHTAAHEAAHVVQQRHGVSLKGGVGQSGDPYEQHADAVADAVVRGESAEYLLGTASGAPSTAVQRRAKKRKASGKIYVELSGEKFAIEGDSLIRDEEVLGTIAGGHTLAKGLRSKAPDRIDFTPAAGVTSPPAGDLLAGAADGTRVTSGDTVWVWSEGAWTSLAGRKGRGGGQFGGYKKTGGGTVAAALTELVSTGAIALTPEQIAIIDAVSKVETGGDIAAVNTYDDQVMSIGFKQVVLGHGSLQKLMASAPAGFAKHGITMDTSKRYPKQEGWSVAPYQIVGVADVEDLRSPEWAAKFYAASMEPDVVAAMCKLMLAEMAEVSAVSASKGGVNTSWLDDPTAHAWLLEVNNNRPAYMTIVVTQVANAPASNREAFLDALAAAIIATYVEQEPLLRYKRAKRGKVLTPDQDAALLDKMKAKYEAKGRHKGENIVNKIPRQLAGAPGGSSPATSANRSAAPTPGGGGGAASTPVAAPQRTPAASMRASWTDQTAAGQSHPTPSGPAPSSGSRTPGAQPKAADAQDDAPWFFGGADVESEDDDPWAMPSQSSAKRGAGPATPDDVGQAAAQLGSTFMDAISGLATPLLGEDEGDNQKKPTPTARATAPSAPISPRSHAPVGPGDVHAFDGKELGALVAQLGSPEASAIAADLAGLVALSDSLRRKASEREERGADRDRLVAAIGALKARLAALPSGRDADASGRFKASVNRTLQEISPFYFQSRNVDILEVPDVTKTRTCNVTVLGMALESLGKDATMYRGRWDGVEAAAGVYKHKLDGSDPKSQRGAVDATQGQGASRTNLTGMRLPDFLELAAIALAMPNGTDEAAVKAGAKEAWDGILAWGNLQTLATQFGVSASIEYLDVSGTAKSKKKHTDSKALRKHGQKHRPDVEKYLNAHIAAEESGSKKSKDKAEALRPAYEAAISNDDLDATVSIDAYREYVQKKVGAELDTGAAVIVGLANHFVKLQAIADDHIVVNDPARASRQGTVLSYEEARAMGYFHMRFVLR